MGKLSSKEEMENYTEWQFYSYLISNSWWKNFQERLKTNLIERIKDLIERFKQFISNMQTENNTIQENTAEYSKFQETN